MATITQETRIDHTIELIHSATALLSTIAELFGRHDLTATAALQLMPALKAFETARRSLGAMDLKVRRRSWTVTWPASGTTRPMTIWARVRLTRTEARIASSAASTEHHSRANRSLIPGHHVHASGLRTHRTPRGLPAKPDGPGRGDLTNCRMWPWGRHLAGSSCARPTGRFPGTGGGEQKRRLTVGKQDRDGGAKVTAYLDAATALPNHGADTA